MQLQGLIPDSQREGRLLTTSAANPVFIKRDSASTWRVRTQIAGAADGEWAEFIVSSLGSRFGNMYALSAINAGSNVSGSGNPTWGLSTDDTVREFARQIDLSSLPSIWPHFSFEGMGHGGCLQLTMDVTADDADVKAMAIGSQMVGRKVVIEQKFHESTINGNNFIGWGWLRHTANANGLLIEHGHEDYDCGVVDFDVLTYYAAMMSGAAATFDQVQFGSDAPIAFARDGSQKPEGGSTANTVTFSKSGGGFPYKLRVTANFPLAPPYAFLHDNTAPNDPKAYFAAVGTRVKAGTCQQSALVSVLKS